MVLRGRVGTRVGAKLTVGWIGTEAGMTGVWVGTLCTVDDGGAGKAGTLGAGTMGNCELDEGKLMFVCVHSTPSDDCGILK